MIGERERLAAIHRFGLLEAPPDAILDRITALAASIFDVPMALVTLLDETRQRLLSRFGLELETMPRELSFCEHTIRGDGVMIVPDALADSRFRANPYVLDLPNIRFYAGAPIVTVDGSKLGAVCILDTVPRTISAFQVGVLEQLAELVVERFELNAGYRNETAVRNELRAIIDAAPFDRIAEMTARGLDVSGAALLVVGAAGATTAGLFGVTRAVRAERAEAEAALVAAVIAHGDALVLADARNDRRARGASVEWGARSLVAVPLKAGDGRVLGILAAFDNAPRSFGTDEIEVLRACANLAIADLEREQRSPDVDPARLMHAERRLALLESVVLTTTVPMAITSLVPDDDPEIVYVNEPFSRVFGYAPEEIIGRGASVTRAHDIDPVVLERVVDARRAKLPVTVEFPGRRKNGDRFWCEARISPVFADDGSAAGFVSVLSDISERRTSERISHDRGEILELIANDASLDRVFDAIVVAAERSSVASAAWIALRDGDVLAMRACGPRLREALGGPLHDVAAVDSRDPMAIVVRTGEQLSVTREDDLPGPYPELARRFGIGTWVATPIRHADGEIVGALAHVFREATSVTDADRRFASELAHLAGIATERRCDRDRLEFLAHHDPMTGLPNRLLLEERAAAAIAVAQARGGRVAIGMCDLDRFKLVNDSLGHAAGDVLLKAIGERLTRVARPCDTVARLGGDEFAVLIDDIDGPEDAERIARDMLRQLEPSFTVAGQEVFVRACMGVAVFPENGADAKTLCIRGEAAKSSAWARGLDVSFPDAANPLPEPLGASRIALETSLRHAFDQGQFRVLFQPLVDLRVREIRGAEALLRWRHPIQGDILPDRFIRAAEDTGLIVPIGAWVLGEACRLARRWQDDGFDRFVSVNVSARQFDRRDFITTVMDALAVSGVQPHRLHIELTESLVMRSPEAAAATLRELKALGVKISIDDFGTGHASFTYLKRFPLDALKIDRLFIRDVAFGGGLPDDEAIVRAIVGVARALDLKVVAEGVETEEQAAFLRALGVPLAQGYLFSRAIESDAVYDWRFTR